MLRVVLFISLFALVGRFCFVQTEGFTCLKVTNNFPPHAWKQKANHFEHLLNQEFRYFKRGAQSFVFLSEDGTVVLKIFNTRLKKQLALFNFFPFSYEKKRRLEEKQKTTFKSYHLALDKLAKETGVIYAHLNPSLKQEYHLHIVDKLGIHHTLSSKKTSFLLQKKCLLFYPTLKQKLKEGKMNEAKRLITSLIRLVSSCHDKGIMNQDPSVRKNYGLLGEECVVLDVGRFAQKEELSTRDTQHTLRRFRKKLVRRHPELLEHFDNAMAQ